DRLQTKTDAVARCRHGAEHGEIPEQNLEEERQVADRLHVSATEPRDEPVRRQPCDADEEAENSREYAADDSDQQRVQQTDQKDAAVRVGHAIGNKGLIDDKARGIAEEAKATGRSLRASL